jgi:hypothetical protein
MSARSSAKRFDRSEEDTAKPVKSPVVFFKKLRRSILGGMGLPKNCPTKDFLLEKG